jgi:hypothetical protein
LLTFQWLVTGAALLLAATAFARGRRLARRIERLTESYWELRYEHGQLRARLNRIDPDPSAAGGAEPTTAPGVTAFVPLSSLKR